jgi:hypothetical protein
MANYSFLQTRMPVGNKRFVSSPEKHKPVVITSMKATVSIKTG